MASRLLPAQNGVQGAVNRATAACRQVTGPSTSQRPISRSTWQPLSPALAAYSSRRSPRAATAVQAQLKTGSESICFGSRQRKGALKSVLLGGPSVLGWLHAGPVASSPLAKASVNSSELGVGISESKHALLEARREALLEAAHEHPGDKEKHLMAIGIGQTIEVHDDEARLFLDRVVNVSILAVVTTAVAVRVFSVDHDWWRGWTLVEILRNVPGHNWLAYNSSLETNPVLSKMCISGVVYSLGDLSAQCYEGRGLLDFDRGRMARSGAVGFCLHGSLSHFYYQFCEILLPFKGVWVVPLKVVFDQTCWSAIWNSIYYISLGLLRFERPSSIFRELKAAFVPLLTAGWKLWPFAHIVTYGVVPIEHRLLWVDLVELIWVTILSMLSNERAEARRVEEEEEALASEEMVHEAILALEQQQLLEGKDGAARKAHKDRRESEEGI